MSRKCGNLLCPNIETPKLRCGACGEAEYCSKSCQAISWKHHKKVCFGRKLPQILSAVEISLFGHDGGGSSSEKLLRIESNLENCQSIAFDSRDCSLEGLKSRLSQLLTSTYFSPIVEVPLENGTVQYAVFSPFCYHGMFARIDDAYLTVQTVFLAGENGTPIWPSAKGFRVADERLPFLTWVEHSLIAVYLGNYSKPVQSTEESIIPTEYIPTTPLSLPRDKVPSGIFVPQRDQSPRGIKIVRV